MSYRANKFSRNCNKTNNNYYYYMLNGGMRSLYCWMIATTTKTTTIIIIMTILVRSVSSFTIRSTTLSSLASSASSASSFRPTVQQRTCSNCVGGISTTTTTGTLRRSFTIRKTRGGIGSNRFVLFMSSTKDTETTSTSATTATTATSTSTVGGPIPYPFNEIETKWQRYWEENKTFVTSSIRTKPKKKYVLDMFPYPSGAGLHVGHPEGYTASDIMARYYRMQQYDVLHPIGWDSFGLPAEQFAIQTGAQPADTTTANIANFKRQLRMLGFSYDWTREIATTDINYVKWTQWIFLQLYKSGLAEQSSVSVNWCPALGTVLANEEVINGLSERGNHPVERLPLRQWILKITKYADKLEAGLANLDWPAGTMTAQKQWIGKSTGTRIRFPLNIDNNSDASSTNKDAIEVFTTRADTIMGVTYVTLAPEHPLVDQLTTDLYRDAVEIYVKETSSRSDLDRTAAKEKTGVFTGSYVYHPLTNEPIPVWIGDYVLGSYGTGAVMAVPAHDTRDYAFATKYNLPNKHVITNDPNQPVAESSTTDNDDDDNDDSGAYTEPGILFNSGTDFDGLTSDEAVTAITKKLEELQLGGSQTTYKLRDWIFSRQRYWGEPIPIYFPVDFPDGVDPMLYDLIKDDDTANTGHSIRYDQPIPVDEADLPLQLPLMADFQPGNDPAGCLARAKEWRYFIKDNKWYARETNTMPQWAGSCWYYFRFLDPNNNDEAFSKQVDADWLPVDLYVGGSEHAVLHLLYARFWHQVLYDLGYTQHPEPFQKLVHQGMILGSDGEKMSKSRGNVINPDDIVSVSGADALRLYEMFMGPLEAVKPWQTEQVAGVVRFMNRVYNLVVTATTPENKYTGDIDTTTLRVMHKTMKKVTEDVESMSFNTAISALMVYTNHLQSLPKNEVPTVAIENLALMISPFAPHLGEECWSLLGNAETLAYHPWVVYDESLCVDDTMTMGVQVNGKTRGEITIAKDATQDIAIAAAQEVDKIQIQLQNKTIQKIIYVPGRILNIIVK